MSAQAVPRVGDQVAFEDLPWTVTGVDGSNLVLVPTGGRWRVAPTQEVVPAKVDSKGTGPVVREVRWDLIPPAQIDRVKMLYPIVAEVVYGVVPGSDAEPRPEYSMDRSLSARVNVKVAELRTTGPEMSRAQLSRWARQYMKLGLVGLVDKRGIRQPDADRVDPAVLDLCRHYAESQLGQSTASVRRGAVTVAAWADDAGCQVPCLRTLERHLKRLGEDAKAFAPATTRRTAANVPARPFHRVNAYRPGQLVELDATPLDVMALLPDGSVGRVDLQISVDVATGTICAALIRPGASSGLDVIALIAKGLTPWRVRPGAEPNAEGLVLSAAERQKSFDEWPVVWPETISIDRGRTYESAVVAEACAFLGISIVKAAPYTPTDKAHVERMFGTIARGFTEYLAGYTGSNPAMRGHLVGEQVRWTSMQIQALLDEWIAAVHQNRPAAGLRHPLAPGRELTPNKMYEILARQFPAVHRPLTRNESISLLPIERRIVQRYGVNVSRLIFDSAELQTIRIAGRGQRGTGEGVEVRVDPYRLNCVWVRHPGTAEFLEVPWVLNDPSVPPIDEATVKHVADVIGQKNKFTDFEFKRRLILLHATPPEELPARARKPLTRSVAVESLVPAIAARAQVVVEPTLPDVTALVPTGSFVPLTHDHGGV